MDRNQAKEFYPILQAFAKGEAIECRTKPSAVKGTKVHDILEKEMPLKGVERSYGAEVCYRVPKSEFEKEEL